MQLTRALALAVLACTGTVAASCLAAKFRPLHQLRDWRENPWSDYCADEIEHNFYSVNMQKVYADHNDIITPTLPSDVNIPTPFLPTDDRKTKDLYLDAIAAYKAEEAKTPEQKEQEIKQKWIDVTEFNDKATCYWVMRVFFARCATKKMTRDRQWRTNIFAKNYRTLKNKLADEMRTEGLVNLGRELTAYLNETGLPIEEPMWCPVPEGEDETGCLRSMRMGRRSVR